MLTNSRERRRILKEGVILLVPVIATLTFWPFGDGGAHVAIDDSWRLALHEAIYRGLHWGPDVAFNYGPLGFLSMPVPYLGWTSTVALVFSLAVYIALATTVLMSLRRLVPLLVALFATIGVARAFPILPVFEALQALAFLWAIELAVWKQPARWRPVAIAAGTLVALTLLAKFNVGLIVGSMMVVMAVRVGRPWWAGLALSAGSLAVSIIAFWLLIGQVIVDLPRFLATSLDLTRGYSYAMAIDRFPSPGLLYALFFLFVGIVALGASNAWLRLGKAQLATFAALTLLLGFAVWKAAFTRLDTHVALAFATINVVAFTLMAPARRLHLSLPVAAVTLVFCLGLNGTTVASLVDVPQGLETAASEIADATIPGRQQAALAATRASLRQQYGLGSDILSALADGTVHIDPFDAGIAAGYPELRWSPLPTFQSYFAYSADLDRANAARLSSTNAPSRILRTAVVVDGTVQAIDLRDPWFESPSAMLQILCRYNPIAASGRWQVLARTARRCGDPEMIETRTAAVGDVLRVPTEMRPGRFVIVNVTGLDPSLVDTIESTILKGTRWYVTLDGSQRYRLVAGTAQDGLLMATPASLNFGPGFGFGPPTRTIAIDAGDNGHESTANLTFEFMSVPWLP